MEVRYNLRKSAAQAKRFLEELANLRDEPLAFARFWRSFVGFFPPRAFSLVQLAAASDSMAWGGKRTPESDQMAKDNALRFMRGLLREAWEVPNTELRRKEWKLGRLRERFHQTCLASHEMMTEPPPESLMDYALSHLTRIAHNAKVCENQECRVTRYFIAERSTKRFCSDDCNPYWKQNNDGINDRRKEKYRKEKGGKVRQYNRSHRPPHVQLLSQQEIGRRIMGWCSKCDSVFTTICLCKPGIEIPCSNCGVPTQHIRDWTDEDYNSINTWACKVRNSVTQQAPRTTKRSVCQVHGAPVSGLPNAQESGDN